MYPSFGLASTIHEVVITALLLVLRAEASNSLPPCSQVQLDSYAAQSWHHYSSSTTSISEQKYECLCMDQSFVISAAQQTFINGGCGELVTLADYIISVCSQNGTTPPLSFDDIVSLGDGGRGDCEAGEDKSGGISTLGWTVIGVVIAVVATIGTFGAWLCPCYRRGFVPQTHKAWYV